MNATKRFGQNQKPTRPNNSNHGPKDAAKGHKKTQLVELNEATPWILKVKRISKMFKDHARTMSRYMKYV
jgi:hypothetical protein